MVGQEMLVFFAVRFAVRRMAKFGKDTKWELVKDDWEPWIEEHVPGKFFDDEAVELADAVLDGIASICQSSGKVSLVLEAAAAKDWGKAEDLLLELLKVTVGGKLALALSA